MIARSRENRSENPGSDEPKKPVRRRFKLMNQGERTEFTDKSITACGAVMGEGHEHQ